MSSQLEDAFNEAVERRTAELRAALEFYANADNYVGGEVGWWANAPGGEHRWCMDFGSIARSALSSPDRPPFFTEQQELALAAVLPLIEQRVIDRLAGTENPYAVHRTRDDDGKQIHYLHRGDPADGESGIAHRAWSEGAACGVAAERARWEALLRDDTVRQRLNAFPLSGAWIGAPGEGRAEIVDAVLSTLTQLAALAPERTTATEPEGEK